MPLRDRRGEYSWPETRINVVRVTCDRKSYSGGDTLKANVSFRLVGGLRESFHPDVWTVAWEDFDKILRLTLRLSLKDQGGVRGRTLAEIKKEVRKATFYWSRDPDLPYRIWAMIVPEDGGPPEIPHDVDDAKSRMLDFEKEFALPASSLAPGRHSLVADVGVRWGRRSFIEKGDVSAKSKPMEIQID